MLSQETLRWPGQFVISMTKRSTPSLVSARSRMKRRFAERWVRSLKEECLDEIILFGQESLQHALKEYLAHYHQERPRQGLENVIPFPDARAVPKTGKVLKSESPGGLPNFYHRNAA